MQLLQPAIWRAFLLLFGRTIHSFPSNPPACLDGRRANPSVCGDSQLAGAPFHFAYRDFVARQRNGFEPLQVLAQRYQLVALRLPALQ